MLCAVLCPLQTALAEILAKLVGAELVVHKTAEGDAVTEDLETADGVTEDDNGSDDKENVLENARKGQDERRRFANLVMELALLLHLEMHTVAAYQKDD